jgi:hypothetical protein
MMRKEVSDLEKNRLIHCNMGNKPGAPSPCLLPPDNVFETWNGIKGVHFNSSCNINLFILSSVKTTLVIWLMSSATVNLNDVIKKKIRHNKNAQRAALWASTLAVAFGSSFLISLLLKFVFGYGVGPPTHFADRLKRLEDREDRKDREERGDSLHHPPPAP